MSRDPHPFAGHSRSFQENRFVYPVVSRRSRGISVGINLNPERTCNFACAYCQVDRSRSDLPPPLQTEDLAPLEQELAEILSLWNQQRLLQMPPLDQAPPAFRRLADVALSGDGEPSVHPLLDQVMDRVVQTKARLGLGEVPVVLITNGSGLHRSTTRRALEYLGAQGGEIWFKLDAGTEERFRQVARTQVPYARILQNLREAARRWGVVIQSCWFRRMPEEPLAWKEVEAFCGRLLQVLDAGGMIRRVQIYTLARPSRTLPVTPFTEGELAALAQAVSDQTGLPVEAFGPGGEIPRTFPEKVTLVTPPEPSDQEG